MRAAPAAWPRALLFAAAAMLGCGGGDTIPPAPLRTPPLGLDLYLPTPPSNPLTPAKVQLGRRLFFDRRLSRDGTLACGSCHRPELAFADTVPLSPGVRGRIGRRNTPSLLNRGYGEHFFWDGRAGTLEEAVLQPIRSPVELDLSLDRLVARLNAEPRYTDAFMRAFGEPASASGIARALASYLRTLRSGGSPADRASAADESALSERSRRGHRLFIGGARCSVCHSLPNFTDEGFHNTGVSWSGEDDGRREASHRAEDRGRFKTPSLRNVACTPPYMHDGSLGTLEEVVSFYDLGGGENPHLDPVLRPLDLSPRERGDLVAFLTALTGSDLTCAIR